MYNIGVFGHRAGNFRSNEKTFKSKISMVLGILKFQYGNELVLGVDGETGVGHLVIKEARAMDIRYHMFLPSPVELVGADWFDEQKKELEVFFKNSYAATIVSSKCNYQSIKERDNNIIEYSNFIICFWEGCRQGRTFDIIKKAMNINKLVLNGLDDLKMISNMDLRKRRV